MHHKRIAVLAVVLLFAATTAVRADSVDDYLKGEMRTQHIPGLSLAVIKDGKIIKAEGYGFANVELNVPVRLETVFKIGSLSKQFIATGIMLLVEEGRISLDDHVSKFLAGTPETWKEITVRHLLTHTSGIVLEAPGFDSLKIQSDADVIKTAYPLPLRFVPGEKWEYCNLGYFALAEIIHKVTGKPWSDYLSEHVFKPLAMYATRTTTNTELVPNRASGYVWTEGRLENAHPIFALRPSGAFLSSVLDLAKWDASLYTDRILKQSSREQMWQTLIQINSGSNGSAAIFYGFGWEITTPAVGHRKIFHDGALTGFRSVIARFVDDKLTVVILTNGNSAQPVPMADVVAGFYVPGLTPSVTK